jgi:hypothetical protein
MKEVTNMNKGLAIMYLYPNANPLIDFEVVSRDGIQTITNWIIDAPEPTEDELIKAWEEYSKLPPPEPVQSTEEMLGTLLLESANDKATITTLEETVGTLMLEVASLKGGNA